MAYWYRHIQCYLWGAGIQLLLLVYDSAISGKEKGSGIRQHRSKYSCAKQEH